MPEFTRMLQDGAYPDETKEVTEHKVLGGTSSFNKAKWVWLESG